MIDFKCPKCLKIQSHDEMIDLRSNLCKSCIIEYNKKLRIPKKNIVIRHSHINHDVYMHNKKI